MTSKPRAGTALPTVMAMVPVLSDVVKDGSSDTRLRPAGRVRVTTKLPPATGDLVAFLRKICEEG